MQPPSDLDANTMPGSPAALAGAVFSRPRTDRDSWAAAASVWARAVVDAHAAWQRWPEQYVVARATFIDCLDRASACGKPDVGATLARLDACRIADDDGTAAWGWSMAVFAMLRAAVEGDDGEEALQAAVGEYAEQVFSEFANGVAVERGRSVSQADAERLCVDDAAWQAAVSFLLGLSANRG